MQNNILNFIFKYSTRYKYAVIIIILLLSLIAIFGLATPFFVGNIVDFINNKELTIPVLIHFNYPQNKFSVLLYLVLLLLFFLVLKALCIYIKDTIQTVIVVNTERDIVGDLFQNIQHREYSYFTNSVKNQIITIYNSDYKLISQFMQLCFQSVEALLAIIISIVYLCYINVKLTFATILVPFFLLFTFFLFNKYLKNLVIKKHEKLSHLTSIIESIIAGIRDIKLYCSEKYFSKLLFSKNKEYYSIDKIAETRYGISNMAVIIMNFIMIIVVLYVCLLAVIKGLISVGNLFAFYIQYSVLLNNGLLILSIMINFIEVYEGMAIIKRHYQPIEIQEMKNDVKNFAEIFNGSLKCKNVFMMYGDNRVLKNISIDLPYKKSLGIIGNIGSGKSTLAYLLAGINKTSVGEIQYGDVDIRMIPPHILRNYIGIVPQHGYLFTESIKDNILLGRNKDEDIDYSLFSRIFESIELDDFLTERKLGIICNQEIRFSGGEKQKLLIARTLMRNPKILILDDSMSSLDAISEEKIVKNIFCNFTECSKIIITNRITTLRHVDHILILISGEIVEQGTHDELVAFGGFYNEFYKKQILSGGIK